MSSTTITFSSLSPEERAKLVRAAIAAEETQPQQPDQQIEAPPQPLGIRHPQHPANITQDSHSREMWLYLFQDALAEDHVAIEQQAEITRAAFDRHEETKKRREKEVKIVSQLVKNLSVSDEVSLMDELQKAIKRAEKDEQFDLLRKLIAVYLELEKITDGRAS